MATEVERLIAVFEARMTQYDKALKKALGDSDRTFKKIETRGSQMEARLAEIGKGAFRNAFGGFITGAGSAVAATLTVQAALDTARAALEQFGAVADQSAAAGVDAEFFQGIAFGARQAGVETEALAGALATFNKNAGLAAEGRGKLASALTALDPALLRSLQLATSQEERIRLVADAIARAKDGSTQAAIAAAAWGDQGARLVAVFNGGAKAVDDMVSSAKALGIVVDRDLIARADELGDRMDAVNEILDTKIKVSLINLNGPMLTLKQAWADFLDMVAVAGDRLSAIENRQYLQPLQADLAKTYNAMQPIKDRIAEIEAQLAGGGPNGMILKLDLADAKAQLAALDAQASTMLNRIQQLQGYKPPGATGNAAPALNADGLSGMFGRGGPGRIAPVQPFYTPGGSSERASKALDKVKVSAAAAGVALAGAARSTDDLGDALDTAEQATISFASTFVSDLRQGKSAAEALVDALGNVDDQLINLALNNTISSLFGGIKLGGGGGATSAAAAGAGLFGRAGGGVVNRGQAYLVGERGPEVLVPASAGVIVPNGRGGGGGNVNNIYNYGTDRVETRNNSQGGIDVIIRQVEDRIKGNMARGQYRSVGVNPALRRT